jgi:hypothetical protein
VKCDDYRDYQVKWIGYREDVYLERDVASQKNRSMLKHWFENEGRKAKKGRETKGEWKTELYKTSFTSVLEE